MFKNGTETFSLKHGQPYHRLVNRVHVPLPLIPPAAGAVNDVQMAPHQALHFLPKTDIGLF